VATVVELACIFCRQEKGRKGSTARPFYAWCSTPAFSHGALYRRFHDKEEVMEEVILGILERQDVRMKTRLTLTRWRRFRFRSLLSRR
jgi:hypothetical protein